MLVFGLLFSISTLVSAQPGVLWSQHEDSAIYNFVGASRSGYVGASTWLNEVLSYLFIGFAFEPPI